MDLEWAGKERAEQETNQTPTEKEGGQAFPYRRAAGAKRGERSHGGERKRGYIENQVMASHPLALLVADINPVGGTDREQRRESGCAPV